MAENAAAPARTGAEHNMADETALSVPRPTVAGLKLPPPAMSRAEMAAWVDGYLAGWDRGEREGYDRAYRRADAEIARALCAALGGPRCGDRAEAVRRHLRSVEAIERRRRADRGEVAA